MVWDRNDPDSKKAPVAQNLQNSTECSRLVQNISLSIYLSISLYGVDHFLIILSRSLSDRHLSLGVVGG